jgi:hypothetical protein
VSLQTGSARSWIRYRYNLRLPKTCLPRTLLWRVQADVEGLACRHGDICESISALLECVTANV